VVGVHYCNDPYGLGYCSFGYTEILGVENISGRYHCNDFGCIDDGIRGKNQNMVGGRMSKLQAIQDQVIVKLHHSEKVGKIYIPEKSKAYNADYYWEIIAVGPDEKFGLKVGDKVMGPRHEGKPIEHENEKYLSLKSKHLWGKIEGEMGE